MLLAVRSRAGFVSLLLLLLLLGACQSTREQSVVLSDSDDRAFRHLELPNRMQVLLISDPGADKAAAALDVHVGSWQDPARRQGLAHFLEHMLFLGTERYPVAGEYQSFISAHGGSHNAYTASEHTNYFFDIDAAYLEPALDRFSQFFVAPLFTAEYVEREKNAVHSEYLARIREDDRRSFDVLRAVANPAHPFSKFSVGSLETLADRPGSTIRDELLAFYDAHYSANLMTLVVSGRESLDELESMVRSRFEAVVDRDRPRPLADVPLFAPQQLPALVQIQPIREQRNLTFVWALNSLPDDFRSKPLAYIGNLVGHEGEGSLLSWLKRQGWAVALSAGEGLDYRGGTTFHVSIDLTEAGVKQVDEIAAALFQTLALVREQGVQRWIFDEQQRVAEQRFRFREQPRPIREVSRLALNLHKYPPAEVVRGDYLMERFDASRIAATLQELTPQRVLLVLTAPEAVTDRRSEWYQTPYSVTAVNDARLAAWQRAVADVSLPAPNRFIAEKLVLKPLSGAPSDIPVELPVAADTPLRLWHLQDRHFRLPKGELRLALQSPLASASPRHVAMTELLARMISENLNELVYPAHLAGLGFRLERGLRGLQLKVEGFDEKQGVLLAELLPALRAPQIDPERFERVRLHYLSELQNSAQQAPYNLLIDQLGTVLLRAQWPDAALAAAAETISADALAAFARELLSAVDARMLVYGNFTADEAGELAALVARELLRDSRRAELPPVAVLDLQNGDTFLRVATPHQDAALLWYRQAADNAKSTRAALGVTAQLLNADFYTRLRTEQQLGYIVMSTPYPVRDVPGLVLLVQSPVAGPAKLASAYDDYLARWRELPAAELAPQFERHRAALRQRLAEQPKNQGEFGARLWQELMEGHLQFDSRQQLIAALDALSFDDWLALFRRDLLDADAPTLWLAVDGRFDDQPLRRGRALGDLETFRQAQRFHLFP
jgi:secreted Zn-dependent insulinase-like peptidase